MVILCKPDGVLIVGMIPMARHHQQASKRVSEHLWEQSGGPLSWTIDQRNPVAQLIHLSGLWPILENAVGCPLRTERLALIHPPTS